ncbi:MAG: rhodanese-like domain-containing protein, partial [Flavobacteriaceae bacterium]|nr:rhodanese-like domain-containing protein [Flavobacteriaceae bacterium]
MKSITLKFVLLIFLSINFISCAQNTKTDSKDEIVSLISPEELNSNIDNIQLIDVRTPKEYKKGHLKNAVNINYYDNDFLDEMSKLDKSKELYIYCHSGNRSGKAAKKLGEMGFTKVYDLEGGITNWNKKSLE